MGRGGCYCCCCSFLKMNAMVMDPAPLKMNAMVMNPAHPRAGAVTPVKRLEMNAVMPMLLVHYCVR